MTEPAHPHDPCPNCGEIGAVETAMQKYGWPEQDTSLPAAVARLLPVRDLHPDDTRSLQVWKCPVCGAFFLYQSNYEYLVNGSEDEQTLARLTEAQARSYLERE